MYQNQRGGSRCCDNCMTNESIDYICCDAGATELCDVDGFGCCPPGALRESEGSAWF